MFDSHRWQAASPSASLCSLLLLAWGCAPSGPQAVLASTPAAEEPDPVVVTVFTDQVELFMEYPRLLPGSEARFLAHITVLSDGAPVRSGSLRLELSQGTAFSKVFEAAQPKRDGLFIPVGTFSEPGQYEARILVDSAQVQATITLPAITVHADLASARAAAEAEALAEPKDAVPFLLEQQWKTGLLLERVEQRSLTRRLQVAGEVEAPHFAMAAVSAPLGGVLLPPESGELPHVGQRVEKGQVLAFLAPPLTTSDRAQLAANETYHDTIEMQLLVREYDLQAKAVEIEQVLMQSKARLEFAQRALARIEVLRAKDLGTVADLEAARRDVEIALRETEGSKSLMESFALSRERLDALQARTAAARAERASSEGALHALIAPISGEIIAAEHVEGEHVEAQGTVYRVLDLGRMWIATHISEFDLASIGESPGALMQLAAYPGRSFDVMGEMGGRIVSIGLVVDPETRTLPLRYEVANPDRLLRAGMFADVFLETQRAIDAVALPRQAIVMDGGQAVAFVLVHGELFQKRVLELGIRDGRFVEVLSGVEAGERVVSSGAYLVKLASASPAAFGEGHAH